MIAYHIVNTSRNFLSVEGLSLPIGGATTVLKYGPGVAEAASKGLLSITETSVGTNERSGVVTLIDGAQGDVHLLDSRTAAAIAASSTVSGMTSGYSGYSGKLSRSSRSGFSGPSGQKLGDSSQLSASASKPVQK